MFSIRTTAIGAAALALVAGVAAPARADLVTDPGFESCIHTNVVPSGWTGDASCQGHPNSGTFSVGFSPVDGRLLSQTIPTTVGATYDFSFWLRDFGVTSLNSGNNFTASFGTDQVLNLTPPSNGIFPYTFENFAVTAEATTTTIQFARPTGFGGEFFLDDVSVTPAPEPASLALLAVGLVSLTMVVRLRRG
jgi:hypothetical protein